VRGEAEIVVGGKIDDLAAIEMSHRGLLVIEHTKPEMSALLLELIQFVS